VTGSPSPRARALGAEMRRLRSYSGLSQRDVARAAGVSQMTVLRWEKGDYLPDLRQAILGDTSRTFEFLLAEAALRWVPAGAEPGMLAAQLRHVAAMSELPHISAGVILTGTPLRVIPLCGFVLHDDPAGGSEPMVQYDIPHTGGYATAPGDVRVYRDQLAALRDAAVTGLAAAAAIRVIAGEAV